MSSYEFSYSGPSLPSRKMLPVAAADDPNFNVILDAICDAEKHWIAAFQAQNPTWACSMCLHQRDQVVYIDIAFTEAPRRPKWSGEG